MFWEWNFKCFHRSRRPNNIQVHQVAWWVCALFYFRFHFILKKRVSVLLSYEKNTIFLFLIISAEFLYKSTNNDRWKPNDDDEIQHWLDRAYGFCCRFSSNQFHLIKNSIAVVADGIFFPIPNWNDFSVGLREFQQKKQSKSMLLSQIEKKKFWEKSAVSWLAI